MSPAYIPVALRQAVRADAHYQCGYCHSPEALLGMPLEFEHLHLEAQGGPSTRENLWLACSRCNDFKGDRTDAIDADTAERVPLFNPRTQLWTEHFIWAADGTHILGRTAIGRATIAALRLNNDFILVARHYWVAAGWWPPSEDTQDEG